MKKFASLLVGALCAAGAYADVVAGKQYTLTAVTITGAEYAWTVQDGTITPSTDLSKAEVFTCEDHSGQLAFVTADGKYLRVNPQIPAPSSWLDQYSTTGLADEFSADLTTLTFEQFPATGGNIESSAAHDAGYYAIKVNRGYDKNHDYVPSPGYIIMKNDGTFNGAGTSAPFFTSGYTSAFKVVEADNTPQVDPAEEAYNAWYNLVMVDMKAVYDANPDWPTVDVPGQKPASVVYAVCEYYQQNNWLFGFMGFGKDWKEAKDYYARFGKTVEGEYADALAIWQAYVDAPLVAEEVPETPEYNTTIQYFTAQQLRAEVESAGKALIGLAGVTTTANKYINGKPFNGTLLSEDGTLAGVRAPQNDEILEVLPVEGGYVLRQADAAEGEGYLVCDAGGNFSTTDVAAANVWTILSPSEDGYGTIGGWADLFVDVEASMSNENLVRFIAKGQYLNGQNRDGVGGLRAGLGAWSFNYVYNANYSVDQPEEPEPVDPNVEMYANWYDLVMHKMADLYEDYGYTAPTADEVGKKPAAVVAPVIDYYRSHNSLFIMSQWGSTVEYILGVYGIDMAASYAEAVALWQAYEEAEVVTEIIPVYVEPVLSAEDVSAEVAYYIYTEARGGLTVTDATATGIVGTAEAGVGQNVDPTDPRQQFAFVKWEGNLYLYNLATQKFLGGKNGGHGEFTDKPVDPILFKNAGNGTVMLYFDDNHNINLGGSKQVTIDGWKQKDGGNSFIIKVAEPFDQTPVLEYLAYHEWNGNVAYTEAPSDIDELLDFDLEFEEARTVEEAPYGVLGAIFDETGDAYAVVFGNRYADAPFTAEEGKVTVHFTKIADIEAELQPAAKKVANRALGLGGSAPAKAKVVICGKSFLVDGENVYGDIIVKNYNLDGTSGAIQTAIETITTTADAVIYDLQGRRVSRVQNGVVIANGKKIVK